MVVKKENLFNNITDVLLVSISIYFIGILVYIAAYQLGYPYNLEWIEGAMMDHVHRILGGKSIYCEPSIDFVPSPYTPIYFYLSAFLSLIFGPTIKVMRWISAFSTLSILLTLYCWGKRETGSKVAGVISSGMFALVYWFVSEWFFLARVDMFSLALFAWAAYFVKFGKENRYLIYAGFLTFLSIFTKQNVLGLALALIVAGAFVHKKRIGIYFLSWFVPVAVFTVVLNNLTDGRFWYYTMIMPMHHGFVETRYLSIFTHDISIRLLIYVVSAIIFLVVAFRKKEKKDFFFYLFFTGALFVSTYLMRLKVGGATNSYLTFFFGGALFLGFLYGKARSKKGFILVAAALILIQSGFLTYDFRRYIPDGLIRRYEHKLVEAMRKMKGDVWLVSSGHLTTLAGKKYAAHQCLIDDSLKNDETRDDFSLRLVSSFRKRKFEYIIVKDADKINPALRKDFKKNYEKTDENYKIFKWLGSKKPHFEEVYVYKRKK